MRRRYEEVGLESEGELHCVVLDGERVYTPEGHLLGHRSKGLMEEVVEEWRKQERGKFLRGEEMGLTSMLHGLWDGVCKDGEVLVGEVLRVLETDLVLYRAGKGEEGGRVREEQDRAWGEYVSLFEKDVGVKLRVYEGVMYGEQEEGVGERVGEMLRGVRCDDLLVWGMGSVRSGSVVLGYGLWRGAGGEEIVRCCTVEERWLAASMGEEEEELKRWEALRGRVGEIVRYRDLVGGD